MATPAVAGTAALLWSQNPALSRTEIRCIIWKTADDIGLPEDKQGAGRVDAHEAVHAAADPASVGC